MPLRRRPDASLGRETNASAVPAGRLWQTQLPFPAGLSPFGVPLPAQTAPAADAPSPAVFPAAYCRRLVHTGDVCTFSTIVYAGGPSPRLRATKQELPLYLLTLAESLLPYSSLSGV